MSLLHSALGTSFVMMRVDPARGPRLPTMTHTVRYPELRELVRAAHQGDPESRRVFAEKMACVPGQVNALNARIGFPVTREDMPDLVQDILTAAWKKAPEYRGESTLESWVYSFCAFELLAFLRRKRRTRAADLDAADDVTESTDPIEQAAIRSDIHLALAKLPEPQAQIVRWKQLCEMTFEEIAEGMKIPVPTAKSWYYRGILRLRELLGANRSAPIEGGA